MAGGQLSAWELSGLLADETRRRVFAALVLGATRVDEIGRMAGLGVRDVVTALGRFERAGLVVAGDDGSHHLLGEAFALAARAEAPAEPQPPGDVDDDTARVLRSFVRDGRLLSIPAQRAKRLAVLDLLAQEFEPGRRYRETQVNLILGRWHADTAALRRYLVDEGFLDRDAGVYWRSGGTVQP